MDAERFRIAVPEEVLQDLRARLDRTRYPDTIEGSGWEFAFFRPLRARATGAASKVAEP